MAQNGEFVSDRIGLFEAGVICAPETVETREAPDTVSGTTNVITELPPFVSRGRVVPAVIGIGFGARSGMASVLGQDGVVMEVTHPPFAGSGATQQSFVTSIGSQTDPSITFYQFDYPYELALGDWTMTARLGDEVLYQTTFTVVPPQLLPELAGACGYLDLLS